MHRFSLSVPIKNYRELPIVDFGLIIEMAREAAHELDRVVYILMEGAEVGCPNRWAVSPKGYLSVEGVELQACRGCG